MNEGKLNITILPLTFLYMPYDKYLAIKCSRAHLQFKDTIVARIMQTVNDVKSYMDLGSINKYLT